MHDRTPDPKLTIYGPAPPEPESGCFKFVLEALVQVTICVVSAIMLLVNGPVGWLLAVLAIAASMGVCGALIWLRDQTRW